MSYNVQEMGRQESILFEENKQLKERGNEDKCYIWRHSRCHDQTKDTKESFTDFVQTVFEIEDKKTELEIKEEITELELKDKIIESNIKDFEYEL